MDLVMKRNDTDDSCMFGCTYVLGCSSGSLRRRSRSFFLARSGRLATQDGISVHVNPVGGRGGYVAPLAIGLVVRRGGLERLVRVEPRPSPPIAPQRVARMRSLAISHHDEPALEL